MRLKLAIGSAALLLAALAAVVAWPRDFLVRQTARETIYVELPFEDVRKILVRSEATDDIMAVGNSGELKEYTLTKRGLGLKTLNIFDPNWRVYAEAIMKVQTHDEEYVGSHLITLKQDVEIENDSLKSAIHLDEGTDRLRDYENITVFSPDGARTKIETSLTLSILVTAPGFARDVAAGRVYASAADKVQNQVAAILRVIEKRKDQPLPLFPILGASSS
jgi:hypothetical protein